MGQGNSSAKYSSNAKVGSELSADHSRANGSGGNARSAVRTPPRTPVVGGGSRGSRRKSRSSSKKKKKKKKRLFQDSSDEDSSDYSNSSDSSSSSSSSSDSSSDNHRQHGRHGSSSKKKKHHRSNHKRSKQAAPASIELAPVIDDEDKQLLELLQEYFAFYGQGDDYSDQIVRDTLDKLGPDVLDLPDEFGNTCLLLAAQYGAFDLIPKLLVKGVNVNSRNKDGACPLHFVCYTDTFSPESAKLLIEHGANTEVIENTYGCTPLHWAASAADISLCKLLCNAGALPSTLDSHGCDPLAYASQQENGQECVDYLTKVKKNHGAFSLSAPTPPKGKYVGTRAFDGQGSSIDSWGKQKDEYGNVYYINEASGESMWEEEFKVYKKDQQERNDGSRRPSLEASSVSKATFEQRLKSMQEKMEFQLVEQLKSLESKIGSPGGVVGDGGRDFDSSESTTVELLRGDGKVYASDCYGARRVCASSAQMEKKKKDDKNAAIFFPVKSLANLQTNLCRTLPRTAHMNNTYARYPTTKSPRRSSKF